MRVGLSYSVRHRTRCKRAVTALREHPPRSTASSNRSRLPARARMYGARWRSATRCSESRPSICPQGALHVIGVGECRAIARPNGRWSRRASTARCEFIERCAPGNPMVCLGRLDARRPFPLQTHAEALVASVVTSCCPVGIGCGDCSRHDARRTRRTPPAPPQRLAYSAARLRQSRPRRPKPPASGGAGWQRRPRRFP